MYSNTLVRRAKPYYVRICTPQWQEAAPPARSHKKRRRKKKEKNGIISVKILIPELGSCCVKQGRCHRTTQGLNCFDLGTPQSVMERAAKLNRMMRRRARLLVCFEAETINTPPCGFSIYALKKRRHSRTRYEDGYSQLFC